MNNMSQHDESTHFSTGFKIMQINTQRSAQVHATALEAAFQEKAHVVCVQEPWIMTDLSREKTQSHPAYRALAPMPVWTTRPRAVMYIRQDIRSDQVYWGAPHPDLVVADVRMKENRSLRIGSVYNAGLGSERMGEGVERLGLQGSLSEKTLICGDFNLHHYIWDGAVTGDTTQDANNFAELIIDKGLIILNDSNSPTHEKGAVLDLALTTGGLFGLYVCDSQVRTDLACGSDHETLLTTIHGMENEKTAGRRRYRLDELDTEKFDDACKKEKKRLQNDADLTTTDRIDDYASRIMNAASRCLDASTPRSEGKGCGYRWWTPECKNAARFYRDARLRWRRTGVPEEVGRTRECMLEAKAVMRRTVRRAKREFFKTLIADIKEPKDIYRTAQWAHHRTNYSTPPMTETTGHTVHGSGDKAQLLLREHTKPAEEETVEHDFVSTHAGSRPWDEIKQEEVRTAIFRPGNTAPGSDNIPNGAWKRLWGHFKESITNLFRAALELGWHPTPFKKACLIALKKPARDSTTPRGYRLISLLSTLGKALERLIARRLAHEAVERNIIPWNYISATPKRAVTDLTLSLTDSLEAALHKKSRRPFASLLTVDIKGAFDAVGRKRMTVRLKEQGWPVSLCKWAWSFLTGREVRLDFENTTTPWQKVGGSLPQGSPVSPILFMLFLAPLYHLLPCMRGYADDGCILVAAHSFEASTSVAGQMMHTAQKWCLDNGLELDLEKTGLLNCTRKRNNLNPPVHTSQGTVIEPTPLKGHMRWLGVHFDRKLDFNHHIDKISAKAARTVNGMRMLSGCFKGAPAGKMLEVARSCVLAQLAYASSTWWPLPSKGRRIEGKAKKLDIITRSAMRAALPVYRTTPSHLLHHAASFPPIAMVLDDYLAADAIRIGTADDNHPLARSDIDGKIDEMVKLLPMKIQTSKRLLADSSHIALNQEIKMDKQEAAQAHNIEFSTTTESTIRVYTDGSKNQHGATGAGWAVFKGQNLVCQGGGNCGDWREVADAEAIAALHGLRAAKSVAAEEVHSLILCVDNYSIVTRLTKLCPKIGTSQLEIDQARKLLGNWTGPVKVTWVPGHHDILGNESADALAKQGANNDQSQTLLVAPQSMSLAAAHRWRRTSLATNFKNWWNQQSIPQHMKTRLEPAVPWKTTWLRNLKRTALGRVLAARSAHGDFKAYHDRFRHEDANVLCSQCSAFTSPFHPWTCPRNERTFSERFVHKLLNNGRGAAYLATRLGPQWLQYKINSGRQEVIPGHAQ